MNFERFINDRLSIHDTEWFQNMTAEFQNHPLFKLQEEEIDGRKYELEVLEWERDVFEEVPHEQRLDKISDYQTHLVVKSATKTIREYYWSPETDNFSNSNHVGLDQTFTDIVNEVKSYLTLASEAKLKYEVLSTARKILFELIKGKANSEFTLYNSLLNELAFKFKKYFSESFDKLHWLLFFVQSNKKNVVKNSAQKKTKADPPIKVPLKNPRDFFLQMLQLSDIEGQEILEEEFIGLEAIVDSLLVPLHSLEDVLT